MHIKLIREVDKFCSGCLNKHKIQIVEIEEEELFENELVKFMAEYEYCSYEDIFTETEEQIRKNFKKMKHK